MRLVPILLLALALDAPARVEELSKSPDGLHAVRVGESGAPARITYDLVARDGNVRHRFESSYQPEEGETADWARDQAKMTFVSWSEDGRYVAIDEKSHRYIGAVLLARVTPKSVEPIPLPEDAILAATKLEWDRVRIRVGDWTGPDRLDLVVAGRVNKAKGIFFDRRRFGITIDVGGKAPRVISVADLEPLPRLIPLANGINRTDLTGDGRDDAVVVAHRENFNAHSFEATTIYVATKDGLQIVPLESGELVLKTGGGADALLVDFRLRYAASEKAATLVTAEREFGDSFADTRPVTFRFYHLARNTGDLPGLAEYYFKLDGTATTHASYDNVTAAFRDELGLAHDGKPGLRERSLPTE